MKNRNENPDSVLLQGMYKGATMGCDSVLTVLGRCSDEKFRKELTSELAEYQKYANVARNKLSAMQMPAKEVSAMEKLPAELGIRMSTMMNSSTERLAEVMIQGSTMGIIEMQKEVNTAKEAGAKSQNIETVENAIRFQQENIRKLKDFL